MQKQDMPPAFKGNTEQLIAVGKERNHS